MDQFSEIAKLRLEAENLQRRLDGSVAELQDLLYTISHDFKGPLRAIMSSGMILTEDYSDVLDATAKAELKRQTDAARRLSKMLEEILKLSRLSRREVQRTEVSLGGLFTLVAKEYGIAPAQTSVESPLSAEADRELLAILFSHLFENSIKFARPDVPLELSFGQDDKGFAFKDNGIGVDPEQTARAFHPFERLNGDAFPGLGMGLTYAKRIVAMHDGTISLDGEPGEGAVVRFTLGI